MQSLEFALQVFICSRTVASHCGLYLCIWNSNGYSVPLYVGCDLLLIFNLKSIRVKRLLSVSEECHINFGVLNSVETAIDWGLLKLD